MEYTYQGCQRLQLWFATPNLCALFLVMLAILCCLSECILSHNEQYRWMHIIRWTNRCVLFITLAGVALTYSRGGYLAMITALLVLARVLRQRRIFVWFGIFCALLFVLPYTAARVGTIGNITEGSILHRLMLWEGVCAIIAEHPLVGIPLQEIGLYYTTWYQPLYFDDGYRTAINDLLTFTASFGLPLSWLFLSYTFVAIATIVQFVHRRSGETLWHYVLSGMIAWWIACAVAGIFNTFWTKPYFALGYLLPLVAFPILLRYKPDSRHHLRKFSLASGIIAFIIIMIIFSIGILSRKMRNYTLEFTHINDIGHTPLLLAKNPIGTTIFIHVSPHLRASIMHNEQFHLREWMPEARKCLRPAVFHHLNATTCYLELGEDWEDKISIFCNHLLQSFPQLRDAPIILLADAQCSHQVLNSAKLLSSNATWIFALYAPQKDDIVSLHEAIANAKHNIIIFTDDDTVEFSEDFAVFHLAMSLSPQVIDQRLLYIP